MELVLGALDGIQIRRLAAKKRDEEEAYLTRHYYHRFPLTRSQAHSNIISILRYKQRVERKLCGAPHSRLRQPTFGGAAEKTQLPYTPLFFLSNFFFFFFASWFSFLPTMVCVCVCVCVCIPGGLFGPQKFLFSFFSFLFFLFLYCFCVLLRYGMVWQALLLRP